MQSDENMQENSDNELSVDERRSNPRTLQVSLSDEDRDELVRLLRASRNARRTWIAVVSLFAAVTWVIGAVFGVVNVLDWLKKHT